jgi:hypothetical protein
MNDNVFVLHDHKVCEAEVKGISGFVEENSDPSLSLRLRVRTGKTWVYIDADEQHVFRSRKELLDSI